MIRALPGILASQLAAQVTNVGTATGLFADPCRAVTGAPVFTGAGAKRAAVFVDLGALDQDASLGARAQGEDIRLPFTAHVQLALAGPETPTMDDATTDPGDAAFDGSDLMLSIVTSVLETAADAGANAPISRAETRAPTRKITAEWRFGQITAIRPISVSNRTLWQLDVTFEGVQVLSPLPAEGRHILRAELDATPPNRHLHSTLQATSRQLPLTLFIGIGPDHADLLASYGLLRLGDLMQVPRAEIVSKSAEIAPDNGDLAQALQVLHAVSMMRLDAVLGGLNAAHLNQEHAALTLDRVWDGTTLTLPPDMRADQQLRVQIMAGQLLRLIRAQDRPLVTLGQLSTLDAKET